MKPTKDEILLFQIRMKRIKETFKIIGMAYKELADKLLPLGESIKKLNEAVEKMENKNKKGGDHRKQRGKKT